MEIETRWMRREDVSQAVKMMRENGEEESEKNLNRLLERASAACIIAESDEKVLGFLAYDVARLSKIKILSVLVDEGHRRSGVGSSMVDFVISKLNNKRNKVELAVSEYNLNAQLFLRSLGFKAVSVLDKSPHPNEYRFVYRFPQAIEESV